MEKIYVDLNSETQEKKPRLTNNHNKGQWHNDDKSPYDIPVMKTQSRNDDYQDYRTIENYDASIDDYDRYAIPKNMWTPNQMNYPSMTQNDFYEMENEDYQIMDEDMHNMDHDCSCNNMNHNSENLKSFVYEKRIVTNENDPQKRTVCYIRITKNF